MIRKLEALGLALVVVCAVGAMGTSAASAAQFTTTNGATLTMGETTQGRITITGQTVTCNDVLFVGTAPASKFESFTVSPRYTECKTNLGTSVNVTGFGHLLSEKGNPKCGYILSSGQSEIECEAGAEVTIDAGPCVAHIPAQKLIGASFSDVPGGNDINGQLFVGGITGTHTDGFLCPFSASGHGGLSVIENTFTMIAEVGGSSVDVTYDP